MSRRSLPPLAHPASESTRIVLRATRVSSLSRCIADLLTGFRSGRMRRYRRMRRSHLPPAFRDSVHVPLPIHFRIGHLEVGSEGVVARHARAKEQDAISKDDTVRVGQFEWPNDNPALWLRHRALLYSRGPLPARSSRQMAKHVGENTNS